MATWRIRIVGFLILGFRVLEVEEEMNREEQLRREIEELTAVTAALEAAAGDLLRDESVVPSNATAREEVIELLGVNYVGPESLGRVLYDDENMFQEVELDYVKLKEILNEPDEWASDKKKFETYALVFKPPISFLELKARANEVADASGNDPAFRGEEWYKNEVFATEAPSSGSWELVRRETVPGSTYKVFDDQTAMIADKPNLTPTTFPALAALLVGQYFEHGVELYEGEYHIGRTSTSDDSGGPVNLGDLHAHGAHVSVDANAYGSVGLSVSRKLKS